MGGRGVVARTAVAALLLLLLGAHRGGVASGPELVSPASAPASATGAVRARALPSTSTTTPPSTSTTTTTPATTDTTTGIATTTVAPATTAVPLPPATTSEEARGRQALARIAFDLPAYAPGWSIAFLPGRPGLRGMAYTDEHRVEVYVRAADTPQTLSYTLAHELGHVIDLTASTPARRAAYRDLRGLGEAAPWFGCDACTDVETPAGDFAETVGYALTDPGYDWSSRLGPRPTPAQVAAVRALYRF